MQHSIIICRGALGSLAMFPAIGRRADPGSKMWGYSLPEDFGLDQASWERMSLSVGARTPNVYALPSK